MNKVISWENKKNDKPLNYDYKIINLFQNLQKVEKKIKILFFKNGYKKILIIFNIKLLFIIYVMI